MSEANASSSQAPALPANPVADAPVVNKDPVAAPVVDAAAPVAVAADPAAPPVAADPTKVATALSTDPKEGVGSPTDPSWYEPVAKELDDKTLQRVKRFTSFKALAESYIQAADRIRTGELAKPLAKDATPEQVAEWRKGNGIPDTPDKYFENLPQGLVIGENDKAVFDSVAAIFHKHNSSPAVVQDVIAWYNDQKEADIAKFAANDQATLQAVQTELIGKWGLPDFRKNTAAIKAYLTSAPEAASAFIADARGPDGTLLFTNPDVVAWFAQQARDAGFDSVSQIGGNMAPMVATETRMADIKVMMAKPNSEYWKGPRAESLQAEYRDLVDQQRRLKGRAA